MRTKETKGMWTEQNNHILLFPMTKTDKMKQKEETSLGFQTETNLGNRDEVNHGAMGATLKGMHHSGDFEPMCQDQNDMKGVMMTNFQRDEVSMLKPRT